MVTPRKGAKRPMRARRPAGPQNPSRAAGEPAPASAAASAAFYAPDSASAEETHSAMAAHLAGEFPTNRPQHVDDVMAQAVPVDHETSADHVLARKALSVDPEAEPEPGDDLESDIARVRKLRRPLGAFTQKLALPKRPGYHSHWFNSEGGRIDDALANGWAHRKDAEGKPVKRAVGRGRDQGVLYAYAMDIPEQFWLEDQAAKNAAASEKMESLKAAPFQARSGQAQRSDQGKFYSPVEGREPLEIEKI